ncbi:MAG: hypothetical protein MK293_02595 [Pedosphaera sp.]|nr:hypothetical protein [Pedosphaera sp.]
MSSTAANSWHWIFWNFRIKAGTLNSQFLNFAIVDGFDLKLGFIGFGTICRFSTLNDNHITNHITASASLYFYLLNLIADLFKSPDRVKEYSGNLVHNPASRCVHLIKNTFLIFCLLSKCRGGGKGERHAGGQETADRVRRRNTVFLP